MPAFTPISPTPQQSSFLRSDSQGSEGLENSKIQASQEESAQDKQAMNNVWNAFLSSEPSQPVTFSRIDSPITENVVEPAKISFEDILAKIQSEANDSGSKVHWTIEAKNDMESKTVEYVPAPVVEEKVVSRLEGSFMFKHAEASAQKETAVAATEEEKKVEVKPTVKENEAKNVAMNTSKEVLTHSLKIGKFGFKEGKEVIGAVSDLFKNFIGFREKKVDPKAKENAEKAAKRKANKSQFIGLLREGMSIYYAAMRRMLIELEVKLGVSSLRTEDKNRLLGRNRNMSFEGNDSVYAIHQTAFEMAEQKRRQMQSHSAPSAGRGKPSAGQIFRDKNMQGERSGGQNMMSAVG